LESQHFEEDQQINSSPTRIGIAFLPKTFNEKQAK